MCSHNHKSKTFCPCSLRKIPYGDSITVTVLTRVDDRQCAHPVVFAAGGAKLNVVSTVVVDTGLGQHSIVLNLRFPGEEGGRKTRLIIS